MSYLQKYFAQPIAFMAEVPASRAERGIAIIQGKIKTVLELIDQLQCLFGPDPTYDVQGLKLNLRIQMVDILAAFGPIIEASDFTKADLERRVKAHLDRSGFDWGSVANAIRFAVTGGKISPGLFEMLEVQTHECVLRRIQTAKGILGC